MNEIALNFPVALIVVTLAAGGVSILFIRRYPLATAIGAPTATLPTWVGAGQVASPALIAPIVAVFLLVAKGQRAYAYILSACGWVVLTATAFISRSTRHLAQTGCHHISY